MLLFIFAENTSYLDVKQEDYRRENIKIIPIDLHDYPAIGQVLLVMINIRVVEIQKIELLEKYAALIEEDLARCQDETNVFSARVVKHLLYKLHERDWKVDKSHLVYQVFHRFILLGIITVIHTCINCEVASYEKCNM